MSLQMKSGVLVPRATVWCWGRKNLGWSPHSALKTEVSSFRMSVLTRRGYLKDGSQPRCVKGVVPGREAQAEGSIGTGYRFRGVCILSSTLTLTDPRGCAQCANQRWRTEWSPAWRALWASLRRPGFILSGSRSQCSCENVRRVWGGDGWVICPWREVVPRRTREQGLSRCCRQSSLSEKVGGT